MFSRTTFLVQPYIALLGHVQKEKTRGIEGRRHGSRAKKNNRNTNTRRAYIVLGLSEPSTKMDGVADEMLFRNLSNNTIEEEFASSGICLWFLLQHA